MRERIERAVGAHPTLGTRSSLRIQKDSVIRHGIFHEYMTAVRFKIHLSYMIGDRDNMLWLLRNETKHH
jgi:hypothetical protein